MIDNFPLTEDNLDFLPNIVKEVEPVLQKRNSLITARDAQELRDFHVGLTPREIRFVYCYIALKDAPTALIHAGIDYHHLTDMHPRAAREAEKLLKRRPIQELIHALQMRASMSLSLDENYILQLAASIAENSELHARDRLEALKLIARIRGISSSKIDIHVEKEYYSSKGKGALSGEKTDTLTAVSQLKRALDQAQAVPIEVQETENNKE